MTGRKKNTVNRQLTYPRWLASKPVYWLWRRLCCRRTGWHLFDEVHSPGGDDGWTHYLSCDACDLLVEVGKIVEYDR